MQTFIVSDRTTLNNALAWLNKLSLDKTWAVKVGPKESLRSIAQNRLYWMWLGVISGDTGMTINELHDWCRAEFLERREVTHDDKVLTVLRSTTDLKVKEFTTYLEQIEAWAGAELGIMLPRPEEFYA